MNPPTTTVDHPEDAARRIPFLTARELASLLDDSSLVVGVKDLQGRYIHVNQPFAELFGLVPEAIIGRDDHALFPSEMARRLRDNDREVLEKGREMAFHERVVIGGQPRIYLTRKFPRLDEHGRPTGICLITNDVTRERRIEQALESIALSVSAATGNEVFDLIVQALAQALEIELAFVARFIQRDPDQLEAISTWYENELRQMPCYLTAGTPCADVIANGFTYISGNLAETHPDDAMAMGFQLTSYAGYPLTDQQGVVIGVLSVCHHGPLPDRTIVEHLLHIFSVRACAELERARTEAALRESEASYRAIFECADDAIFVHDLDTGAIVDVNRKACETYGYTREELLTVDVSALSSGIPPHTGEQAGLYLGLARAGQPQRFEWHRRNKDGSLHWDEVTLTRVTLSGTDRILAFTREITERKEWESTLVRSENRLRAMVTSALDSIITMDASGRIVGFNPAAEACFGWRESEVLGQSLAELIIPKRHRKAHVDGLKHYLRTGERRFIGNRVELTALRRDGSEFPIELAIAVSQGRDGDLFVGYLRDISQRHAAEQERLELEAQLRQAQKMEAIGHLAGGIAHDFNNILTGVVGYLDLGRVAAGNHNDRSLERYLDQAWMSAHRAGDLVRQLLTFSRSRGGQPEALELAELVRQSIPLLQSTLPSSVALEFQLDDALAPAWLDPVQAEQVLLNLCINARDAMGGRGRIIVRVQPGRFPSARCASCQQVHSGEMIELSVTDSGGGIDAEHADRIFEPFYSTKPAGQGSGMGLAIVHGIVHEAGGHILLDSGAGTGTTFRIVLPVHRGQARAPGHHTVPEPAVGAASLAGQILVIDDEPEVLAYMTDQLAAWGLKVTAEPSARQALDSLERKRKTPDAVIVDYTMPDMNGVEFIERLRECLPDVPVLLYSGYTDEVPRQRLAELGVAEPLGKPVDPRRLHDRLADLLKSSGQRPDTN
jgi:PAS domain S-box-containing protein